MSDLEDEARRLRFKNEGRRIDMMRAEAKRSALAEIAATISANDKLIERVTHIVQTCRFGDTRDRYQSYHEPDARAPREIGIEGDFVVLRWCEDPSYDTGMIEWTAAFPAVMLTYSDEELQAWINERDEREAREDAEEVHARAMEKFREERALYERLRAKYEGDPTP